MAVLKRELRKHLPRDRLSPRKLYLAVAHALRACGYECGLSCRPGLSRVHDHPTDRPRIEVAAIDDLESFAAKLGGSSE